MFLEKDGKLKPVLKKRVGFAGMTAPAREHTEIFTLDGSKKIGKLSIVLDTLVDAILYSNCIWLTISYRRYNQWRLWSNIQEALRNGIRGNCFCKRGD